MSNGTLVSLVCPDSCEDPGVLGGAGVCNTATGLCECPEGYTGTDDWQLYNDCHVNESLRFGVQCFCFVFACLIFVLAVGGLIYLLFFWDYVRPVLRRNSSYSTDSNSDSAFESAGNSGSQSPKQAKMEKRAKRRRRHRHFFTFGSIYLFISFSASALFYWGPSLFGKYRSDALGPTEEPVLEFVLVQDLALAVAANSIFVGLWVFLFLWYSNLPSLRLYSRLFDINSIIIRRPTLVKTSLWIRVVLLNIVNLFLLVVYYHVIDKDLKMRETMDTIFLYCCAFYVLDFMVFALILVNILKRLFQTLKGLSDEAVSKGVTTGSEKKPFNDALHTIRILFWAIVILAPPVLLVFLLTAAFPLFRTRIYLALNFCAAVGMIASLVVLYILLIRLRGSKQSSRRESSAVGVMGGV